jgi:tetratricopeptide (TPR) repeat protein
MAGAICRLLRRKLDDYLDGELAPPTRGEVERHLEACPPCQALLSDRKREYAAAELIVRRAAPEDFVGKVMARLSSEPQPRATWLHPRRLPLRRMVWAAAALAVVALLAGRFTGRSSAPTSGKPEVATASTLSGSELLELGALQEENGQLEAALATYQAAAEYKETRADALMATGRIYEELGFPSAALEAFDKALSQQANPSPADRRNTDENV